MKSLSLLTEKIRSWNSMGLSLLPSLEIAIIHSSAQSNRVIELLDVFGSMQLLYDEKNLIKKESQTSHIQDKVANDQTHIQTQIEQQIKQGSMHQEKLQQKSMKQISIQQWDLKLKNSIYAIYLAHQKIQARVHLIIDQEINGKIDDQSLKATKKIIQRLKRNKSIIFVNFNSSTYKLDVMSEHIEQFGLSFRTKERQIKADRMLLTGQCNKKVNKSSKKSNTKSKTTPQKSFKPIHPKMLKKQSTVNPQFTETVRSQLNSLFILNPTNSGEILLQQIERKYISLFGTDINKNFNEMKGYHKRILCQLKRYEDIMRFIQKSKECESNRNEVFGNETVQNPFSMQKDLTSYGLNCLYKAKEYLIASLMGTYSNIEIYRPSKKSSRSHSMRKMPSILRRSLHWQIMEIMNEIWDIQGDSLLKQLQKMPLSYIKQRYKMLDYQTIGGFMPSSCFQAIFAGPLKKMVEHIMETMEIVEMKINAEVKSVMEYFFAMTSVSDDVTDLQCEAIKKICEKFRKQTQKVLQSQIEFISVSHEDFWSFKQVKSSIYGPQQQAYIEIKYIGKNYVKKVFEGIRETLPRLIGQNLLREIVQWLQTNSVEILMEVVKEKRLEIIMSNRQIEWIEGITAKEKKIDHLVYFFSLKTSSETGVKNLHQNLEKNWKRMFKNKPSNKIQVQEDEVEKRGGFIAWARNLIKRNKVPQKKRSSSQQKESNQEKQIVDQQNPETIDPKKHFTLTQKNWLLILNIDKSVELQKIQRSSEEGFPQRLRPSIWLYLAKKQISSESAKKVQTFLDQGQMAINEEKLELIDIFKQIDKDINRTPPAGLFRKGYLKDTITRILQAYSIYDKSLRYTQGMNFIVSIILCVLTHYGQNSQYSEQTVKSKAYFQSLQNQCMLIFMYIMEKKGLRKIMFIERATITDLCVRLEEYILQKSQNMSQKIERSGFSVEMMFSGALISGLTTSEIEFKLQKRVIDLLLTYEFSILYKIIGQFIAASESLCENLEGQNLYYFLKGKVYNDVYKQIGDEGLAKMFHNL